jgi:hypothetical protein
MADQGQAEYRKTLRERFLAGETDTHSDETLLELLLTFAVMRIDTRPLAEKLVNIFGSLSRVLSAAPEDLNKIKGLGPTSVTLLKMVNFIRSGTESPEKCPPATKAVATQQKLFADPTDKNTPKHPKTSKPLKIAARRKFQVSRSHLLEFNHFSRILSFLYENKDTKRISRPLLIENSGLPDGQVASLVSIGASMGLIQSVDQRLAPIGLLIAEHDIFFEKHGSLEWCHYKGAGSYQNLIWFEVFNHLLAEEAATTQDGWHEYFRRKLSGQYAENTIRDHVPKEVRFIIDAYLKRNFSKLEILHQLPDNRLYRRRYTGFAPFVLVAMIYDFCASKEARLFQVDEMAAMPGSPAMVFGLDVASFRQQIEGLHNRGWLRYETTHNLDQIRLKPGYSALEFLTAYFDELGIRN